MFFHIRTFYFDNHSVDLDFSTLAAMFFLSPPTFYTYTREKVSIYSDYERSTTIYIYIIHPFHLSTHVITNINPFFNSPSPLVRSLSQPPE